MSKHLRLDIDGQRATITLDRPDKHDMLEAADLADFEDLLGRVDGAGDVRVLVVTGAGEAAFSSGFAHGDVAATDWRDNPVERLCARIEDARVPTICALNGSVYGGAADIALACDFRIGVEGMRLMVPAARLGVFYNVGGLRRFAARLGAGPARRLLIAGEAFDGQGLLHIGYLDALAKRDVFDARVDGLAERIASLAPRAVQGMKRALVQISRGALDEDWAQREILACFESGDLAEGLAAFAEKRAPKFTGR